MHSTDKGARACETQAPAGCLWQPAALCGAVAKERQSVAPPRIHFLCHFSRMGGNVTTYNVTAKVKHRESVPEIRVETFLKYQTRKVSHFSVKSVRARDKALCFPLKVVA